MIRLIIVRPYLKKSTLLFLGLCCYLVTLFSMMSWLTFYADHHDFQSGHSHMSTSVPHTHSHHHHPGNSDHDHPHVHPLCTTAYYIMEFSSSAADFSLPDHSDILKGVSPSVPSGLALFSIFRPPRTV